MKKDRAMIHRSFGEAIRKKDTIEQRVNNRQELLQRMGCFEKKLEDIPQYIENMVEQVLNPWLAYKAEGELGLPKEMLFEEALNLKDWRQDWSEWCEFWLESFKKIPHPILLDSKRYYQEMKMV